MENIPSDPSYWGRFINKNGLPVLEIEKYSEEGWPEILRIIADNIEQSKNYKPTLQTQPAPAEH